MAPGPSLREIAEQKEKELAETIAAYRQTLAKSPDDPDALFNLAERLLSPSNRESNDTTAEAMSCYRRYVALYDDPDRLSRAGYVFAFDRLYDEAAACYRKALQVCPDHVDALTLLGDALQSQGLPADAIPCYRKALALSPDDLYLPSKLGEALLKTGQLDEAIAYLRSGKMANTSRTLYLLGNALAAKGLEDDAIEAYRHSDRASYPLLRPDEPLARLLEKKALRLQNEGLWDQAILYYRESIANAPAKVETLNALSACLHHQGAMTDAIASLLHILETKPDDRDAKNALWEALENRPSSGASATAR